jgi:hypothetical protein
MARPKFDTIHSVHLLVNVIDGLQGRNWLWGAQAEKEIRAELRKATFLMREFAALCIYYHYYCCYILFQFRKNY